MINPNQLRPLISALYGLVATVMLMLALVVVMVFLMPTETPAMADAGGAASSGATGEPAPTAPKTMSADAVAGKDIFNNNCAACHSAGADKLVGPGLKGVRQRTPGEAWLQKWIRNSSALIAAGDAYAVKVFNDNGQVQMTSFASLTDQQIKQILDYVDASN
ncbi:c-type cytochrome [Fibrella sp. WM1]|uniref:c-type cytochrome n=1 Tax=Fibrella musci TaxID=3242485 RepID=UPI00351FBD5B